jgi:hypothetical protein
VGSFHVLQSLVQTRFVSQGHIGQSCHFIINIPLDLWR